MFEFGHIVQITTIQFKVRKELPLMFRLLIGLNTIQTVFMLYLQDMLIAAASVSSILSM